MKNINLFFRNLLHSGDVDDLTSHPAENIPKNGENLLKDRTKSLLLQASDCCLIFAMI